MILFEFLILHRFLGYTFKTGQIFTLKDMKLMKEKIKPFMFFMVINNLLLSLYSQVSRLKRVAGFYMIYYTLLIINKPQPKALDRPNPLNNVA